MFNLRAKSEVFQVISSEKRAFLHALLAWQLVLFLYVSMYRFNFSPFLLM
jgi:hypothetical protein